MAMLARIVLAGVATLADATALARPVSTGTGTNAAIGTGATVTTNNANGQVSVADVTTVPPKGAVGYTRAGFAAGAPVTYYTGGISDGQAGLTPGLDVYQGAAGAVTTTAANTEPAVGAGRQFLGKAISATAYNFISGELETRTS